MLKLKDNAAGLLEGKLGGGKGPTVGNDPKGDDLDDNTRKQFLSLTDEDFPLVCTFDFLLRLIENNIRFVVPPLKQLQYSKYTE